MVLFSQFFKVFICWLLISGFMLFFKKTLAIKLL